jgi:hypothetical protein
MLRVSYRMLRTSCRHLRRWGGVCLPSVAGRDCGSEGAPLAADTTLLGNRTHAVGLDHRHLTRSLDGGEVAVAYPGRP